MPLAWTTRPARADDAPIIARHRYFGAGTKDDIAAYDRWVAVRIDRGHYTGVLAEDEQGVIAGAGAVLLDWGPARGENSGVRARIVNVFTEPAWRRQGIARSLMQDVMRRCQKRDVQVFSLAATDDSVALYRSLGFEPYPSEMILRPRG